MFEIVKRFDGYMLDRGKFDLAQQVIDDCLRAVTNVRGKGGEYRVRVQWFSDDELANQRAGKEDVLDKARREFKEIVSEDAIETYRQMGAGKEGECICKGEGLPHTHGTQVSTPKDQREGAEGKS